MEKFTARILTHEWQTLPPQCLEAEERRLPLIQEGDEYVGKAPEDFRRIFTLATCYIRAGHNLWGKYELLKREKDRRAVSRRLQFGEALARIAWALIREHFDLWGETSGRLRVCEGWTIVFSRKKISSRKDDHLSSTCMKQ